MQPNVAPKTVSLEGVVDVYRVRCRIAGQREPRVFYAEDAHIDEELAKVRQTLRRTGAGEVVEVSVDVVRMARSRWDKLQDASAPEAAGEGR